VTQNRNLFKVTSSLKFNYSLLVHLWDAALLVLFLFMVYECIGCHHTYDKKGPFSRHQARCAKFKQEAQKRRQNYSLAAMETGLPNVPVAGGSDEAGVLLEDAMNHDEAGPALLDGQDVNMADPIVSLASKSSLSCLTCRNSLMYLLCHNTGLRDCLVG
jgi:hypothetical protein